jgi:hypothetical protein
MIWFFYRLLRPAEPPPRPWYFDSRPSPKRPYSRFGAADDDSTSGYRSPLGLVDNPNDEWLEWAIMEDILDGPDEGLLR